MSDKNAKEVHLADLVAALRLLFPANTRKFGAALLGAPRNTVHRLLYGDIVVSAKRLAEWNAKLDRALDADQRAAEIRKMRKRLRSHRKGEANAQVPSPFGRDDNENGSQTA
jgi:hypothetical protein